MTAATAIASLSGSSVDTGKGIGVYNATYLNSQIDDFRMYDSALSSNDIKSLYKLYAPKEMGFFK